MTLMGGAAASKTLIGVWVYLHNRGVQHPPQTQPSENTARFGLWCVSTSHIIVCPSSPSATLDLCTVLVAPFGGCTISA